MGGETDRSVSKGEKVKVRPSHFKQVLPRYITLVYLLAVRDLIITGD